VNILGRCLRFQFVGVLGIGVQLATLALFARGLGINEQIATILAVETAVLHNFVWHERWTWRDRNLDANGAVRRLWRFHLANGLISICGNLVLMQLYRGWMGLDLLVANLASIGTIFLLNFSAGNWFVFEGGNSESKPV
jgi:putative flippase GtrA